MASSDAQLGSAEMGKTRRSVENGVSIGLLPSWQGHRGSQTLDNG
jgi:hypothetical protein